MTAPTGEPASKGLRSRVFGGAAVNGAFFAVLYALNLVKGLAVASLLTPAEFGIWGIIAVGLGSFLALKHIGVGDKYVQQVETHQEAAFQRAFTAEVAYTLGLTVLVAAFVPMLAAVYGQDEFVAPGLVYLLAFPALALQFPAWAFYRQMRYMHQRALLAVDPAITFVVTMVLALAGLGYWSLVIGTVTGSWVAAFVAVLASPYRVRLRFEGLQLRRYAGFSWPILAAALSALVMAQTSTIAGEEFIGLSGIAAIYLALLLSTTVRQIDEAALQALYPAVCAVRDDRALLFESFWKTNRMLVLAGLPLGIATALFIPDLIRFGLGSEWEPAETMLQIFGLIIAIDGVGLAWREYQKALDETRPLAVVSLVMLLTFLGAAIPLMAVDGLRGFALGMAAAVVASVSMRLLYVRRMFPEFRVFRETARAAAPTAAAVALVLAARVAGGESRSLGQAVAEVLIFVIAAAAITVARERRLIAELRSAVNRGTGSTAAAGSSP